MNSEELTNSEVKSHIKVKRLKNLFTAAGNAIGRFAEASWKGAALGALIAMILHVLMIGSFFKTGISSMLDWLLIVALSAVIIFGTVLLSKPVIVIFQRFNPWFVAVLIATLLMSQFLPLRVFGQNLIILEMLCGALVGFAVSRGIKRPLSLLLIFAAGALNLLAIISLASDGSDDSVKVSNQFWNQNFLYTSPVSENKESRPDFSGIKTLHYGSGTDKHRKEYREGVTIHTKPVDTTPFFDQTSGFGNTMREFYWGFNSKSYPLNARVWYKGSNIPSPLVIILHGNHNMFNYSDPGYEYLGKHLASQGYIAVSVDENFLNGGWMGDYNQSEVFTRAWILLKHLQLWREWNSTNGNPFFHKVDMNKICLIGHSRGGAAIAVASIINRMKKYHLNANEEFNFDFNIRGIVQIAPNDPYNPQNDIPLKLENINYLLLQGGYDQDMSWFLGNRVYNRLRFTDGRYHFKTALYIYRANHGQFNSVWGRTDHSAPLSWFTNLEPIMDEKEQQKIAVKYISHFLEAVYETSETALAALKDFRIERRNLPRDYYINQFEDSDYNYIAGYEEDIDVSTATIPGSLIEGKNLKTWSENTLSFRDDWNSSQQNSGVYLGWDKTDTTLKGPGEYQLMFTEGIGLDTSIVRNIFFFICNNKDDVKNVDFTIELVSETGSVKIPFSELRILPPPLKTRLSKWPFIHAITGNDKSERVLQLTEIPVKELLRRNNNFNVSRLQKIRFIFDRTESGEVFLDKIGWN